MLIEFGDAFDYAGPTSRAGAAKFKIMPLAGPASAGISCPVAPPTSVSVA
jgi:hypothetical protein